MSRPSSWGQSRCGSGHSIAAASCSTRARALVVPDVAVTIGARIHVHGVEQVQADRSYVYVANHASLIDTPALFA
jgi:hypothetical protein